MLRRSGGTAGRSHRAACVGLSVAALMALRRAVAAITSANCAYMRPVSPGRNAAGRNTDISTSVIPMIGPNSCRMAALAASRPGMPFSILWTAPSTTTMASSTTIPMASTIANRVEKLMVNPSAAMAAKADDGHRHCGRRYQHRTPVLQEYENDDEDEDRGLVEGLVHFVDGLFDESRGVERDAGHKPLGELTRQRCHLAAHLVRDVERIRPRRLEDRQARGRIAVERKDLPVGLGSELDASHVSQARDLAATAGLDDHVGELRWVAELARDIERVLERLPRRRGRCTNLAGRDLRALLLQRLHDVLRHQPARLHLVGIEPNAH